MAAPKRRPRSRLAMTAAALDLELETVLSSKKCPFRSANVDTRSGEKHSSLESDERKVHKSKKKSRNEDGGRLRAGILHLRVTITDRRFHVQAKQTFDLWG